VTSSVAGSLLDAACPEFTTASGISVVPDEATVTDLAIPPREFRKAAAVVVTVALTLLTLGGFTFRSSAAA
jgi:hypothetical protein